MKLCGQQYKMRKTPRGGGRWGHNAKVRSEDFDAPPRLEKWLYRAGISHRVFFLSLLEAVGRKY